MRRPSVWWLPAWLAWAAGGAQAGEHPAALMALLDRPELQVPRAGLHCEINGTVELPDGSTANRDVNVGDIIADFQRWSAFESDAKVTRFECDTGNPQQCDWTYGEKPNQRNPGWDIVIRFRFDTLTGRIEPASLECIQVP